MGTRGTRTDASGTDRNCRSDVVSRQTASRLFDVVSRINSRCSFTT